MLSLFKPLLWTIRPCFSGKSVFRTLCSMVYRKFGLCIGIHTVRNPYSWSDTKQEVYEESHVPWCIHHPKSSQPIIIFLRMSLYLSNAKSFNYMKRSFEIYCRKMNITGWPEISGFTHIKQIIAIRLNLRLNISFMICSEFDIQAWWL